MGLIAELLQDNTSTYCLLAYGGWRLFHEPIMHAVAVAQQWVSLLF